MPSIHGFKPRFQSLLRPLMHALARLGVTANQVTIAAVMLSLGAGVLIASAHGGRMLLLLPLALLLRMAMNALDGMLAREYHQATRLGGILNELGDVMADAALYLPLAFVAGFTPWLIACVVFLALMTEMTGVMGLAIGATRRYDGPLGKSDRALVFGVLGLLLGFGARIDRAIPILLCLMCLLLVWTVVNRARGALRESTLNGEPQ